MRFSDHPKLFAHAVLAAGEGAARAVLAYLTSADGIAVIIATARRNLPACSAIRDDCLTEVDDREPDVDDARVICS